MFWSFDLPTSSGVMGKAYYETVRIQTFASSGNNTDLDDWGDAFLSGTYSLKEIIKAFYHSGSNITGISARPLKFNISLAIISP